MKDIYVGIGLGCAFLATWGAYAVLAYREQKPDNLGRTMIKPGPASWLLVPVSIILFLMFGQMTVKALAGQTNNRIFWLLFGPPATLLTAVGVYGIAWARLRVSAKKVEIRGLRGWEEFTWENVIGVDNPWPNGPCLKISGSRSKYFWPFGYGVQETQAIFDLKGKPFDIG